MRAISSFSLFTAVAAHSDQSLNLLQLQARTNHLDGNHANRTHTPQQTLVRERQLCPHEIEAQEANKGDYEFGCRGTLRAKSTKMCSFWGEPHWSNSWVTQLDPGTSAYGGDPKLYDVFFNGGLFRAARAKDDSWEVQIFNCGVVATSIAVRFGKGDNATVIEAIGKRGGASDLLVNGKPLPQGTQFPARLSDGTWINDSPHKLRQAAGRNNGHHMAMKSTGACLDSPSGDLKVDLSFNNWNGGAVLNMLLEAAEDSYTTCSTSDKTCADLGEDKWSICNRKLKDGWDGYRWDFESIPMDEVLFTVGSRICEGCIASTWRDGYAKAKEGRELAKQYCAANQVREIPDAVEIIPSVADACAKHSLSVDDAKQACEKVKDEPEFFKDCQFDWCMSGGDQQAADAAEDNEANEFPEPKCVNNDGNCDPAKVCCGTLKNGEMKFDNVIQSNLDGSGNGAQELRYGSVIRDASGQAVDLRITSQDFVSKHGNKKTGVEGGFGAIAIDAGTSATFKFEFVKSGTNEPYAGNVISSSTLSFMDVDQGKRGKQRETVQVCGASNAIVTSDTQLEVTTAGNCISAQSTQKGTGSDNPTSPDAVSDFQRARSVAYQLSGSSFDVTLSVSAKGKQSRKFLFTGHPTVACA